MTVIYSAQHFSPEDGQRSGSTQSGTFFRVPDGGKRGAGYSFATLLSGAGEPVLIQQLYQCVGGMEGIGCKRQKSLV